MSVGFQLQNFFQLPGGTKSIKNYLNLHRRGLFWQYFSGAFSHKHLIILIPLGNSPALPEDGGCFTSTLILYAVCSKLNSGRHSEDY